MPLLDANDTALVVVDVQAKLMPAISKSEDVVLSLRKLVLGANVLGVPLVVTEQYPERLGRTVAEISGDCDAKAISKLTFSCCGVEEFNTTLSELGKRNILLAGVETHVCVYQTAIDLLERGYQVFLVADAVGSRTPGNREIALTRLRAEGVKLCSVEMVLFELLREAQGDQFKAILRIVK